MEMSWTGMKGMIEHFIQVTREHQEMLRPAVAALAELERQAQITFFDVQRKYLITSS